MIRRSRRDESALAPVHGCAGEPARFIAARLAAEGFIADADLFTLLRVTGLERNIEAGNFMLADTMTMPEVAEACRRPSLKRRW